ncbi:MAG: hypothetical protein Nk1A_7510 [Endomicrobiia bacterium]|nr:MAG: hypothetical protein Nk1A_7510 [Endomicrobiia bacterium]
MKIIRQVVCLSLLVFFLSVAGAVPSPEPTPRRRPAVQPTIRPEFLNNSYYQRTATGRPKVTQLPVSTKSSPSNPRPKVTQLPVSTKSSPSNPRPKVREVSDPDILTLGAVCGDTLDKEIQCYKIGGRGDGKCNELKRERQVCLAKYDSFFQE